MASLDAKQVEPSFKELSPPWDLKKKFYETFCGSLMGQTFLLTGLISVYLATEALLYSYAKVALLGLREDLGAFWFWTIHAVPLACILLFLMLPLTSRALREKRLGAMALGGAPKPGYFRLQPYRASDHDAFRRLDGAECKVLSWLKSSKSSLLYLSGASGVGKSSLLSAARCQSCALQDGAWSRRGYSVTPSSACAQPYWAPRAYSRARLLAPCRWPCC
jgi:hypothetical protein